jgi:hypothetical protein
MGRANQSKWRVYGLREAYRRTVPMRNVLLGKADGQTRDLRLPIQRSSYGTRHSVEGNKCLGRCPDRHA